MHKKKNDKKQFSVSYFNKRGCRNTLFKILRKIIANNRFVLKNNDKLIYLFIYI